MGTPSTKRRQLTARPSHEACPNSAMRLNRFRAWQDGTSRSLRPDVIGYSIYWPVIIYIYIMYHELLSTRKKKEFPNQNTVSCEKPGFARLSFYLRVFTVFVRTNAVFLRVVYGAKIVKKKSVSCQIQVSRGEKAKKKNRLLGSDLFFAGFGSLM